ncbi:MAG: hypothetical protein JWM81_1066 [Candidatus Saccharibacteria bacterium]|nr:hypothetical protein [Candidatus Saccharibacteria bacterium]
MLSTYDTARLQTLAQHIGFEFDPATCAVDVSVDYRYRNVVLTETGGTRYAELSETDTQIPYVSDPADGIVDERVFTSRYDDWDPSELDPDEAHDKSLHGLIEERDGYVALYRPRSKSLDCLHKFTIINGPEGANNLHRLLGRKPGIDIPTVTVGGNATDQSTAGQITEAIADMKILTPGPNYFYLAAHDLGFEGGGHGPSWPNTPASVYCHLSRVAQDAVDTYGDQIHYSTEEEKANRPHVIIAIAKALDNLIFRLRPAMQSFATMELRVRDGRYNELSNQDIAMSLVQAAVKQSADRQHYLADTLLAVPQGAGESERYRRGYFIGLQMVSEVAGTRLALHEVRPHPEASLHHTRRALDIISAVKLDIDERIANNRAFTLA